MRRHPQKRSPGHHLLSHAHTHPPPQVSKDREIPLWATCQGFQLVHVLAAGTDAVLTSDAFDSEDLPLALDVTPAAPSSRLLGGVSAISPRAYSTLTTQNVTENLHHDGVEPAAYTKFPALADFFTVLSTNKGRKGLEFVSTVEARNGVPIFASQWHPERNQFEWNPALNINHSADAVHAMQTVAQFFVDQTRLNSHAFPSPEAAAAQLLYNYQPVGTTSYQMYTIP